MTNSRALAAKILMTVLHDGQSLNQALDTALPNNTDRGFIQELCYGVMRWYWPLTTLTRHLLNTPLKEKDADIQILLLLGLYQLIYLQTPQHAALNETVEAARDFKKQWATKLINGVLRQFLRQQESLSEKIKNEPTAYYAHPKWLLKKLQAAWPKHWEKIVTANNQRPPFALRVNRLKNSREEYLQILQNHNIEATSITDTLNGVILSTPCDVKKLPGFVDGKVSVQDAAAQLAAELLELKPGQTVLDACAAPGGKTAHILETEPQLEKLIIVDIEQKRLEKIKENLTRLRLLDLPTKIQLLCEDATKLEKIFENSFFDRILLDVPCSATGVIRRHPDIKFLRRSEDISALAKIQLQLLNKLWPLLKPGGILLYATCSILPDENYEVLKKFIATHTDAKENKIDVLWGHPLEIGRQIFPGENDMDGFYYVRLEKKL